MMNYKKNTMKFGKKLKNSLKKEFDSELVYNSALQSRDHMLYFQKS